MGKRSVRENKNIYQLSREACGLTRDAASEMMEFVSADRIEKIESERSQPHPEEVMAMAKCYKRPSLNNYYCSHECPIGMKYVPEVEEKDLTRITLEILAGLNSLEADKNRLIDIASDAVVHPEEVADFVKIRDKLNRVSAAVDALGLWIEQGVAEGTIRADILMEK